MRISPLLLSFSTALLFTVLEAKAQQVPDITFKPPIAMPAYAEGKGPVVLIDEGHFNFPPASGQYGKYLAFANLLFRDGYQVQSLKAKFTKESLKGGRILVIAYAGSQRNQDDRSTSYAPAFTDEEVAAVRDWVKQGGSLFLIVDHLPMPAANDKLAQVFGVEFHNGYAIEPGARGEEMIFKITDNSLRDHPITRGRNVEEIVYSVTTFTGSAFQLKAGGEPLLVLRKSVQSFTPTAEEEIRPDTPKIPAGGWLQGATLRFGKGRLVVLGEAEMFSAQVSGLKKKPMGMNTPIASQNPQFLLNVAHWLSGLLGN